MVNFENWILQQGHRDVFDAIRFMDQEYSLEFYTPDERKKIITDLQKRIDLVWATNDLDSQKRAFVMPRIIGSLLRF